MGQCNNKIITNFFIYLNLSFELLGPSIAEYFMNEKYPMLLLVIHQRYINFK